MSFEVEELTNFDELGELLSLSFSNSSNPFIQRLSLGESDILNWKYSGESVNIGIRTSKGDLVGHFGLLYRPIQITSSEFIESFEWVDFCVHPSFRNQGLGRLLNESAKGWIQKREGRVASIHFPNENSRKFRKQEEHTFFTLPLIGKNIDRNRDNENSHLSAIEKFDERVDKLFEESRTQFEAITCRTQAYLNWRIFENPISDYSVLGLVKEGELSTYVILKIFDDRRKRTGHIIDILSRNEDDVTKIIQGSEEFMVKRGVSSLTTYCSSFHPYFSLFREAGFELINTTKTMAIGFMPNRVPVPRFQASMIDHDIY